MPDLPVRFKAFAIGVGFLAGVLLFAAVRDWNVSWGALVILGLAGLLAESFTIELPKYGAVSISFIILQAAVIVGGPATAVLAGLSMAVAWRDLREHTSPYRWLFNGSQYALAAGAAALVYVKTGGPVLALSGHGLTAQQFPLVLAPLALAIVVFFAVNTVLVAVAIGLGEGASPLSVWRDNVGWAIPNYFALAPLGAAVAQIYMAAGAFGIILVIMPLLIAKQTFQVYMRLRHAYLGTVRSLVAALEAKDPYTRGHSERVAAIAVDIGKRLGLSEDDLETLRFAGILHDIGKIGTARYILRKPAKLSPAEFQRIRLHPESGAMILREVSFLSGVVPVVFHHHEHWDGSGYVDGIAGEEIPLLARILAVADAFDAMTSPRPYRPAMDEDAACRELETCSGGQFDAQVAQAFLETKSYARDAKAHARAAEDQLTLDEVWA